MEPVVMYFSIDQIYSEKRPENIIAVSSVLWDNEDPVNTWIMILPIHSKELLNCCVESSGEDEIACLFGFYTNICSWRSLNEPKKPMDVGSV